MKTVCVIGEGAWGTAIATLLASNNYTVKLWCHEPDVAQTIRSAGCNERYLPMIPLNEKIQPTCSLQEALQDVEWVFEAIPVKYLRQVLEYARPFVNPNQIWVMLSKGIEQKTLLLPTQMVDDVFNIDCKKVVVAGPSFAHEVATKQITAVTIATPDKKIGDALHAILANDFFKPYRSTDMIGVQAAGALKNVITLAVGMLDGAGYVDNAKAMVVTQGLHEMSELTKKLGGKQETVYGLAGVGDLILTAMGKLSKNLALGKQLGMGKQIRDLMHEIDTMPEGVNTVEAVYQLMSQHTIALPICENVYRVIFEGLSVAQMIRNIMMQR